MDDLSGDGKMDKRDRVLMPAGSVVKDAHAVGLFLHACTFRNEPRRLASDFKNDPKAEYELFHQLGWMACSQLFLIRLWQREKCANKRGK